MKDSHGYVGASTSMELVIGLGLHAGMECLMKGGTLEDAVREGLSKYEMEKPSIPEGMAWEAERALSTYLLEGKALIEALLRGWYRIRWPLFNATYEVVDVEKERRTLLAPNVMLLSRDDGLLRDRESGQLLIVNWKTTSSVKDWDKKWHYDVQAWTEALAAEQEMGEPVGGVIFEGFYKGVRKDNRQCSDLLYGYKLEKKGLETKYSVDYKKPSEGSPWKRFYVPEESSFGDNPLAYWVGWLPWDDVAKYFVTSDPVMKEDLVTQEWINQVVRLETEVENMLQGDVTEEERLTYFIQNFSHFNCGWCPFERVCLGGVPFSQMVEEGKLVKRVDHHALEGEVFEE